MNKFVTITAALFFAAPAFADGHAPSGDPALGEKAFKQCTSCHTVTNDAGEKLAGGGAKTGPNLYGVAGRPAGSYDGFKYSSGMLAAGESGLIWTEETLGTFIQDPTAYLREVSGDGKARSKMTFKLRKAEDAPNIYAFLYSLANPE